MNMQDEARRVLGIVGHAQEKFTERTERLARQFIEEEVDHFRPTHVCSGHSPMGGVDIYAEEIAAKIGIPMIIHAPQVNLWGAPGGFKERNLAIARDSDLVVCFVVEPNALPPGWGRGGCYHCWDRNPPHVKSGGCWTAWKARERKWRIIS